MVTSFPARKCSSSNGLEIDIRQKIAAVAEMKVLFAQQRLDILDSAARPEDFRFVNELDRMAAIVPLREEFLESRRAIMGVDDERLHPGRDEMIEREGDERLLKNRDKRLRQILGQGTQPHPKPSAENKSLRDHRAL